MQYLRKKLLKSQCAFFSILIITMNLVDAIEESKRLLGIASLKEKQEAAIMSFLGGRDTVVSLPRGYGKSLIYALLPHAFDMIRGRLA